MKTVMHDVTGFRRVWNALTRLQREAVEMRCDGFSDAEIMAASGLAKPTISRRITEVIGKFRAIPELEGTSERGATRAICYRLGYEQALQDIETRIARKQAA